MHEDNSLCDGIALLAEGRIKGQGDILKLAFTLNLSLSFEYYMKRQKTKQKTNSCILTKFFTYKDIKTAHTIKVKQ